MFLRRVAWLTGSIFFLCLVSSFAQPQIQGTSVAPPLFQGIMVDAKGKTVGRIYINALLPGPPPGPGNQNPGGPNAVHVVIRQIDGVWVGLPVTVR